MSVWRSTGKSNGKSTHFAPDSIREWLSFDASDGEILRDSNLFSHDSELWFTALNESDLSGVKFEATKKEKLSKL